MYMLAWLAWLAWLARLARLARLAWLAWFSWLAWLALHCTLVSYCTLLSSTSLFFTLLYHGLLYCSETVRKSGNNLNTFSDVIEAKSVSVSASGLDDTPAFNLFCLPPGPNSFIPCERLRDLVNNVHLHLKSPTAELFKTSLDVLNIVRSTPRIFRKKTSSEDNALRPVLNQLLRYIMPDGCSLISEESLQGMFLPLGGFQLASQKSKPEPVITYESFGLVGSEAKGFHASAFKCLSQGSQISGDCSILLRRGGLNLADCAVPGILMFSDSVQFYASYLLPEQYPSFAFLSRPLSVADYCDRLEISAYALAIRSFAKTTIGLLKQSETVQRHNSDGIASDHPPLDGRKGVLLKLENVFVKPIRLRLWDNLAGMGEECEPFRVAMSHNLEIYDRLHSCDDTRPYVNFPMGWLQVPGSEQPAIRDGLINALSRFQDCATKVSQDKDSLRRLPCLVFQTLPSPWTSNPPFNGDPHVSAYLSKLEQAVKGFERAGVVHMDLRPANVMWTCSCFSRPYDAAHDVDLRVVDWEDARFLGEILSTMKFKNDMRYPLSMVPDGVDCASASAWIDSWALDRIREFCSQSAHRAFTAFINNLSETQIRNLTSDVTRMTIAPKRLDGP